MQWRVFLENGRGSIRAELLVDAPDNGAASDVVTELLARMNLGRVGLDRFDIVESREKVR